MEELNIPNKAVVKTAEILHIPSTSDLERTVLPVIPKQTPDAFSVLKQTTPDLIARSFGFPFLQTEIYKGRIPISVRDEPITTRKSQINTSIYSDLQFVDIGGFKHIPIDCVLFDVRQDKNIVKTDIQGRDGAIVEYNGLSDYEVNIKGIILGDNGVYPFDQVSNLVEFLRRDQSLGVVSSWLNNIFDINELVIKGYGFEQTEGSQSHQKFEIVAWSHKPVEVLISEAK